MSIIFEKNTLKEVIDILSFEYRLNFSYINNEIPLQKIIHYKASNQPLRTVLDSICEQASLVYYVIGTQIVLKELVVEAETQDTLTATHTADSSYKRTADTVAISNSKKHQTDLIQTDKNYNKYFISVFGKRKTPDSIIVVDSEKNADSLLPQNKSRKYVYVNRKYLKHIRNARNIRELFSISVFVGPGISYRTLTSSDLIVTDRNESERSIGNIFGGLYLSYFTDPHISLRTGISYLSFGEQGAYDVTYMNAVLPPSNNSPNNSPNNPSNNQPAPTYTTSQYTYKNQYNYLTIPFMVGYTFDISRKFHASVYSGLSLAFLVKMHSTYSDTITVNAVRTLNLTRDPHTHSYTKTGIVLPVLVDIGYQLNKKMQVFFMPSYNYFLTSIYSKDDLSKQKPYAFNFSVGVRYMFDRH